MYVHYSESRLAYEASESQRSPNTDAIGTTETVDGDTATGEHGQQLAATVVDHGDLDGDTTSMIRDGEVDNDPFDPAEVEALDDEKDCAGGIRVRHVDDQRPRRVHHRART